MARADFQKTKKRDNARSENQRYSIAGMQWATETPVQREEDKRRSILEVDEEDDPRNTPVELPVRAISFAKKKSQAGEGVVAPVVVPAGGDAGARSHASSAASNPSRRVSWAGTEGGLQLIPEASLSPGQSHDPAKPQLVGWSRYASHDGEAIAARAGVSLGTPRGDSPGGGSSGDEAAAALAAEVAAPERSLEKKQVSSATLRIAGAAKARAPPAPLTPPAAPLSLPQPVPTTAPGVIIAEKI